MRLRDHTVTELLDLTVDAARELFADAKPLRRRLDPLADVGLGYLRLGQPLSTLSGGEAQRVKLAAALADGKSGSIVLLDEPSAGLHAADLAPLLRALEALVARGDTVVLVEHDMRVAALADWVIDLGPGAGAEGGAIVAEGPPADVAAAGTLTSPYLRVALGDAPRPPREKRKKTRRRHREASIDIHGAREHNLKDVSVSFPRERLVAVTGPSGSGKSTLAFDVLFAEGQRRYLETLAPYARQYMPQLPRPQVDRVVNVPPAVSLEQRKTRGGATSTVGTLTEVAHHLRVLWARAGTQYCPDCDEPIEPSSVEEMAQRVEGAKKGKRGATTTIFAPIVRARKGHHRELLGKMADAGFRHIVADGVRRELTPGLALDRYQTHEVDVEVASWARGGKAIAPELRAALRRAAELGEGSVRVEVGDEGLLLSTRRSCRSCGRGFPELDPRFFSFNTDQGRCEECAGLGWLEKEVGRGKKRRLEHRACVVCDGTRLAPIPRAVRFSGSSLPTLLGLSVGEAEGALGDLEAQIRPGSREARVAEVPLAEARARLAFLRRVGLGYLGLNRSATTLSGGELQRVRLAAQLGSGLTGVLYVLDEPTIGLHPRDTHKLIDAMRALVDEGSSVVVVEHDADVIRAADHIVDIGPMGGAEGGRVVAEGPSADVLADAVSGTARALSAAPPKPAGRDMSDAGCQWLELRGASENNLRDVNLRVPLGRLVSVTGVSGSGKSSLVRGVLLPAVRQAIGLVNDRPPGAHRSVRGVDSLVRAVEVDQSPIGRTPRSVPATYVGIWDPIRKLLAGTPEARAAGYTASRFSFNTKGGRCPECEGNGVRVAEMSFLPDVVMPCETCSGARFSPETLRVRWRGLSAGEILGLDVSAARRVFEPVRKVEAPLAVLEELGLGYLHLGQPSHTLSGGEAQRLKLVSELGKRARGGGSLYVLDEPTTGLHRADVVRLVGMLQRLVERGDSVVVIEHQPDLIQASDWVVDLGPEGGLEGGRIVAEGPPEAIIAAETATGAALAVARQPGA